MRIILQHIVCSIAQITLIAMVVLGSAPLSVYAIIYSPGETLDPGCLPTDASCSVEAPITGIATSTFKGVLIAEDVVELVASTTPTVVAARLYNVGGTLFWNGGALGAGGSGLTNLNGLTTLSQVFAVSTAGSDVSIVSSGSTHTLIIPDAGIAARGLIGTSSQSFAGAKTFTDALTILGITSLATTSATSVAVSSLTTDSLTVSTLSGLLFGSAGTVGTLATSSLGLVTTNVSEGTNQYWTQARFDAAFAATSTTGLTEGTNLYFTDTRARNVFSSTATGLTYATSSGIFSLTAGYNIPLTASTTAWNTFFDTPSTRITAGSGLSWSGNTLSATAGTSAYASTTADGIVSTTTQSFAGNKTFSGSTVFATTTATVLTTDSLTVSTLSGLLFGSAGTVGTVATSSLGLVTTNIEEGSNLYWTQARFNAAFAATSTTGLSEGANLYWTEARGSANFAQNLAATTTTALAEGSNLYFTNERVRNALSVTSPLTYSTTTGVIGITFASATSDGVVSTTTQTFVGEKTFSSSTVFSNTLTLSALTGGLLVVNSSGDVSTTSLNALITNTLMSSGNIIISNVNGITSTTTAVNSVTLATTTNTFAVLVNDVASIFTNFINSLTTSLSGNVLTTTVNGVSATSSVISDNTITYSGNTVTTNVNGIISSTGLTYASASTDGLVSTTTQTFSGNKLFNSNVGIGITPHERLTVSGIVALGEQTQATQANSTVGFGKLYVKQATGSGIDRYVSLLLHADGVDGSTTLADSSNEQNAFSVNGDAKLSTLNPKFGTAALVLDGAGDYVAVQSSVVFDMINSQPFTIDMWVYASSTSGTQSLVEYSSSASNRYELFLNNGVPTWEFNIGGGGPDVSILSSAGSISGNTWTHIAMRRVWTGATYTYTLFVNGVPVGSASNTTTQSTFTNSFTIGASVRSGTAGSFFSGYIDELRISQSSNRYPDTSFTPETSPYGTGLFYQLANGSLVELAGGGAGGSGSTLDVSAFHKNGDAFGATSTVGSLDAYGLQFMTNGEVRALFGVDGLFTVSGGANFVGTTTVASFVANSGVTISSSTPVTTTNSLYNQGGTLYWNGAEVGGSIAGTTGQTVTFDGSGNPISTNTLFIDTSNGRVGIGTISPSSALSVAGDIQLTGTYFNFGTTTGTLGYGLRDKNGVLEFKNLGGDWTAMGTSTGGTGSSTPLTGAEGNILTFDVFGDPVATSSIFLASNGYFGIGTTSPNNRLYVDGAITIASGTPNVSSSALYNQGNTLFWNGTKVRQGDDLIGTEGFVMSFDNAGLQVATSSIFIGTGGNVGIGTTSPTARLSVSGDLSLVDSTTNAINFGGALSFKQNATTSMIIGSNGFVGIGTTTPQLLLHLYRNTAGAVLRLQDGNAICDISPTNGALNCSSDRTLKKNIENLDNVLDSVSQLHPVVFDWNSEDDGVGKHIGFIAQEVEALFPGLVMTDPDSKLKSVSYTNFIPILVQSIQDILSLGDRFKNNLRNWLADAGNGIQDIFSRRIRTEELCVGSICVTEADFQTAFGEGSVQAQQTSPEPHPSPDTSSDAKALEGESEGVAESAPYTSSEPEEETATSSDEVALEAALEVEQEVEIATSTLPTIETVEPDMVE